MGDDPLIRALRELIDRMQSMARGKRACAEMLRRERPDLPTWQSKVFEDEGRLIEWLADDLAALLRRAGSHQELNHDESRSPDGDGQSTEWSAVGVASRDDVTTAVRGNEDGGVLATEGRVAESTPEQSAALRDASGRRVSPARPAGSTPADSHTNLRRAGSEPPPEHRYLHYAMDKHQSSPEFRDDLPQWLIENCDEYCDVVVDLQTKRRYCGGQWVDVAIAAPLKPKYAGPKCIACGEMNDGAYAVEDGPGTFCSGCWLRLEDYFQVGHRVPPQEAVRAESDPPEKELAKPEGSCLLCGTHAPYVVYTNGNDDPLRPRWVGCCESCRSAVRAGSEPHPESRREAVTSSQPSEKDQR